MPEGPEVTVITDGLRQALKNNKITLLALPTGSKFNKKTPIGYNDFIKELPLKVVDVKSKGKFIYLECQNGWMIFSRLLMSGGWFYKEQPKHNHLEIQYTTSKSKFKSIWYVDPRHFCQIKFTKDPADLEKELNKIGPDLLNQPNEITEEDYLNKMRKHNRKTITKVLMDQSIYSGIGNYLKSEILYKIKVSPHALIKNLPDEKIKELLKVSKEKILESYKAGGASVRNYSDIEGKDGTFSFSFLVYMKEKDPLGNKIKREKTKDGRTSHWVPMVQLSYAESSSDGGK